MSLDVYLETTEKVVKKRTGVFVRENGKTKELSLEEAKKKFPNSNIDEYEFETNTLYSANITHNLGAMAKEAGIYEALWRPSEVGIALAKDLIYPLKEGLHKLKMNPERFRTFNPENGWGDYEGFVEFVNQYLDACYKYPDAKIEVSR